MKFSETTEVSYTNCLNLVSVLIRNQLGRKLAFQNPQKLDNGILQLSIDGWQVDQRS